MREKRMRGEIVVFLLRVGQIPKDMLEREMEKR